MTTGNEATPGTPAKIGEGPDKPAGDTAVKAGPAPVVMDDATAIQPGPAPAGSPDSASATAGQNEELIGSWLAANLDKLDGTFRVLLLTLGFLLGSFAAANSDLWLNLATGRLIAEGKYEFGVDPFAYTTMAEGNKPAVPWVNHSWLYSWIAYVLFEGQGMVLVIFKAALVTALGGVLLLIRPRHPHGWVGILGVMLILVVISPRLTLQPIVVSFFFMGVTLLILHRGGVLAGPEDPVQPGLLWLLPVLFALWVNLDVWFIAGPLTLLLCLLALPLEAALGRNARVSFGTLAAVLAAGVAACLINPFTYQALLAWPRELGYLMLSIGDFWPESMVAGGRTLHEINHLNPKLNHSETLSQFSRYMTLPTEGLNVAGISYFVLLGLTVASFVLLAGGGKMPGFSMVRLVPVVVLGILSLWQVRMVPWFALIGGTVALLNLQEFLAWREQNNPGKLEEQKLWGNLARLVAAFLFFGLFFLSWPGWLNSAIGEFNSPRRVAWHVEVDPSLKQTAEFLGRLHQEEKLSRGLNMSPGIAHYSAWFSPGVRYFIDDRFQLFARDYPTFSRMRRALVQEAKEFVEGKMPAKDDQAASANVDWRKELDAYGIDHVVGVIRESIGAWQLALWSWQDSKDLDCIYADGRTVVLAWKKAAKPIPTNVTREWRQQAFAKTPQSQSAQGKKAVAPLEEDPGFWRLYLFGQKRSPLAAPQAQLLLEYYKTQVQDRRWRSAYMAAWQVASFSLPAGLGNGPLAQDALIYNPWLGNRNFFFGILVGRDLGPPEAPLLAIRSCWEALSVDPQDARNYWLLAELCKVLENNQENHWVGKDNVRQNLRTRIRQLQFVGAMKHYLLLNPQDSEAHWHLAEFFLKQNWWDLALEHMQQSVAAMSQGQVPTGEFLGEKNRREKILLQIETEVNHRLTAFDLRTTKSSDVEKVEIALLRPYEFVGPDDKARVDPRGMGLVQKALQILEKTRLDVIPDHEKAQVVYWQFKLLLDTGRLWQIAQALPIAQGSLDRRAFDEFEVFLGAATGDYAKADKALERMEEFTRMNLKKVAEDTARGLLLPCMSFACPQAAPPIPLVAYPPFFLTAKSGSNYLAAIRLDQAEKRLVRGLMALEDGNTEQAQTLLKSALEIVGPEVYFPDRKIAERYLDLLKNP